VGGQVFLQGQVPTERNRSAIEETTRQVPGVDTITDEISVREPPTDSELVARVQDALSTSGEVNTGGLIITASEGVVSFQGNRQNHEDIDRILSIALMVPGVRDIKSEMTLGGRGYDHHQLSPMGSVVR